MHPHPLFAKVTQDLNLVDWEQDWGICNADGARLAEFVDYFHQLHGLGNLERDWADLLLESANDVLRQCGPTPEVWDALELVTSWRATESGRAAIEYWLGILDEEESVDGAEAFPIAVLLQETMQKL